jgi:hypothetical protein
MGENVAYPRAEDAMVIARLLDSSNLTIPMASSGPGYATLSGLRILKFGFQVYLLNFSIVRARRVSTRSRPNTSSM